MKQTTPDKQNATRKDIAKAVSDSDLELTASSLIAIDYIAPPAAVSDYITTLYHFRCDEKVIRDIQPSSVGHLSLFARGNGHMHFREGHIDPNFKVSMLTPLANAAPFFVDGPMHIMGAALTPLGWAALTGLHAGQYGNRLVAARDVLGEEVEKLGERIVSAYLGGSMTGREGALEVGEFIARTAKPLNSRHVDLIRLVNRWLGSSFNPDVSDLMRQAAYSERQVQRLVERYFGLPPKDIARKYRALRAAALLSFPSLTPDYEAALGDAFFDQSHMIREINRFVGRTPARLGNDDSPFLNEMIAPRNLRELDERWGADSDMLRPLVEIGKET